MVEVRGHTAAIRTENCVPFLFTSIDEGAIRWRMLTNVHSALIGKTILSGSARTEASSGRPLLPLAMETVPPSLEDSVLLDSRASMRRSLEDSSSI